MLLTGTFPRLIDDKGRIAIPKPLRDCLSEKPRGAEDASSESQQVAALFVAPGTDSSLFIFPEQTFAQQADRLTRVSPNAPEVRDYSRLFFARAVRVELDKQGRIRLPQELIDLARLGKEATLLGVQDHLELWDRERWNTYLTEKTAQYDEIAEAAFAGGSARESNSGMDAGVAPRVPR